MRYLVTGANGMLAADILDVFSDFNPIALSRVDLDISDLDAALATFENGDIVLNCAAYNAVDEAESDPRMAYKTNADGPAVLAEALKQRNGTLVHFSTDYVFGGASNTPHLESESRSPESVYGKSKAIGEVNALSIHPTGTYVVRTAWLYGKAGSNFASKILERAQQALPISVVSDQVGQPTWTRDLAIQVKAMLEAKVPSGVYHGTNAGEASWFEFAQAIVSDAGFDPKIVSPTTSEEFVRPAARPSYSVLSHGRWNAVGMEPMRNWTEALQEAFESDVFDLKTTATHAS